MLQDQRPVDLSICLKWSGNGYPYPSASHTHDLSSNKVLHEFPHFSRRPRLKYRLPTTVRLEIRRTESALRTVSSIDRAWRDCPRKWLAAGPSQVSNQSRHSIDQRHGA